MRFADTPVMFSDLEPTFVLLWASGEGGAFRRVVCLFHKEIEFVFWHGNISKKRLLRACSGVEIWFQEGSGVFLAHIPGLSLERCRVQGGFGRQEVSPLEHIG